MKVLVTGAYGQLGSELSEMSGLFPTFGFIFTDADTMDITNENAICSFFEKHHPDFVVNCAAYTAVDKAEDDQETAKQINSLAPGYLASACKKTGAKLIHISTDYIFNGENYKPYTEEDKTNPLGVYGKTKYNGEVNCLANNPETLIIRTSWLYSSFGNNFVKTMVRLGKEKDSLRVVSDQVGSPTYAMDLAGVILKIINDSARSKTGFIPGIYNYSNEGICSWYDFAIAIHKMANIKCHVSPVRSDEYPAKSKRPHYSVLDKSKIKSVYKITIPYWRESLKECVNKIING